jgi:acyl carrier protein
VPHHDPVDSAIRELLVDVLGVAPATVAAMTDDTPLFGALPELDSMAVASLLTEMEDRLEIMIDDDDVDGELFESYGSLIAFVRAKVRTKAENQAGA